MLSRPSASSRIATGGPACRATARHHSHDQHQRADHGADVAEVPDGARRPRCRHAAAPMAARYSTASSVGSDMKLITGTPELTCLVQPRPTPATSETDGEHRDRDRQRHRAVPHPVPPRSQHAAAAGQVDRHHEGQRDQAGRLHRRGQRHQGHAGQPGAASRRRAG